MLTLEQIKNRIENLKEKELIITKRRDEKRQKKQLRLDAIIALKLAKKKIKTDEQERVMKIKYSSLTPEDKKIYNTFATRKHKMKVNNIRNSLPVMENRLERMSRQYEELSQKFETLSKTYIQNVDENVV